MEIPITPLDSWIIHKIGHPGRLTRQAIEEYQLEQLRETLCLARSQSPFYRKHLSRAPEPLSSLGDLAQFPFTAAQDIRDFGLQFLCVSQDKIQRVVTLDTTGTTGQPKRIYFTEEDQELTTDFFHNGMATFTAPGDRVLILLPCERAGSVGDLLATGLQRLGAEPIRHGIVRDIAQTLGVMRAEKVDSLVGIPVQVLGLARHSPEFRLKSVLLSTDYVPDAVVRAVEREWHCQVYNHYGMTEMGLGGGVECLAHRGYHLREADLYFEIVHPETGQPVAEGETGEVVFTTLTRAGMPLIRYRTGDISRFIPGACPCGTSLKNLEWIRARKTGRVAVGPVESLTIADLDEALFSVDSVYDYDASVSHEPGRDILHLSVYVTREDEPALKKRIAESLETIPAVQQAMSQASLFAQMDIYTKRTAPVSPFKRTIRESGASGQ
ncbi:coenzyme F390 synthetase [Longilinea arvoryzae]|uniref:Coenzyme F390 synthetase n=1 Tax=Longilinea arvoryzae TaxID=360412 RepID=A0A0S7BHN6_9CHLR|nr:AMP-binding protein [Longilinea arvoryzae]GAP13634.1 coenzyme F390 synthetase [Longilinea arvoryzae]